jgi:hypothetical protein
MQTFNIGNVPIVKPFGNENLYDFAKRIVNELSQNAYDGSVTLDCGEGIMIKATKKSTLETIMSDFEKEFIDGFHDRYKKFEDDLRRARVQNGYNG